MAKQFSKTVIGGFMVSAMVLLVIAVVIFGGGRVFQKTFPFVLFFKGSVKGLKAGSPVLFRGVEVGSVEQIVIQAAPKTGEALIPVVVNLNRDNVETDEKKDLHKEMSNLIEHGLRAQLTIQSFVTGQLMIELDFHPDKPAQLVGIDFGYPEIPTISTPLEQIAETFEKYPLNEFVEKINAAIDGIEKVLVAPELMEIVRSLNDAAQSASKLINNGDKLINDADNLVLNMDRQVEPLSQSYKSVARDAQNLLRNVDSRIDPLSDQLDSSLNNARSTLEQMEKTFKTYSDLVEDRSELRYKLDSAMNEVAAAARSIRELAEYMRQHPEALLRGKGGNRR